MSPMADDDEDTLSDVDVDQYIATENEVSACWCLYYFHTTAPCMQGQVSH